MKNIVNANDVIKVNVENPEGESLGEIQALMLDKITGKVAYVVLSFGGFLGMGSKLFALPWAFFSYNKDRDCFVINMSKEKLRKSPGFDKDNWPDMSSPTWVSSITDHYANL